MAGRSIRENTVSPHFWGRPPPSALYYSCLSEVGRNSDFRKKILILDFRVPTLSHFRFPTVPISDTSDCSDPPLLLIAALAIIVFTLRQRFYSLFFILLITRLGFLKLVSQFNI